MATDFDGNMAPPSGIPRAGLLDIDPGRGEFMGDGIPRTALGLPYDPCAGLPPLEGRHPDLLRAGDIRMERPRFLDDPLIPLGVLTLIAGRAGVSKSTLSISRAAMATRGTLEGDYHRRPCTVAFSGIEDSLSMQKARLMAADADMDRTLFLTMMDTTQGSSVPTGMSLPDDLPEIRELLATHDVRMWVIDPITSCLNGDTNKRDDVRRALDPLAALAGELDIAIVGILHFNKGGGYASDKISGSHAFRDTVRSLILVARDDADGSVIATLDKSSYTMAQGTSYSYGLMSVDVTDDQGETMSVPKVTGFMPTDRSVNEVINRNVAQASPAEDGAHAERGEVIEWLTDYLRDGPASFKDIAQAASDEGYSKKQLAHARERASDPWVASIKDATYTGKGQRRVWALADHDPITSLRAGE